MGIFLGDVFESRFFTAMFKECIVWSSAPFSGGGLETSAHVCDCRGEFGYDILLYPPKDFYVEEEEEERNPLHGGHLKGIGSSMGMQPYMGGWVST